MLRVLGRRTAEAAEVHAGLADLAMAFLGAEIDNLGYIPFTRDVCAAAKSQTPFFLAFPSSPAAAAFAEIATQLTERSAPLQRTTESAFLQGTLRSLAEQSPQNRRESLQEAWAIQ